MSTKVDLGMVRDMAGRYEQCAQAIAALNTTEATESLTTSLPGTDTGRFAAGVGKRVDAAFDATGTRINNMARTCRSAADNYNRTDEASAANLMSKGVF